LLRGEQRHSGGDCGTGSGKEQHGRRKSERKTKPPSLYSDLLPPELMPRRRKDERKIECSEEGCDFRSEKRRGLVCHQIVVHKKIKLRTGHAICQQCGASILGYGLLLLHKKVAHPQICRRKLYERLLEERLRPTCQIEPSENQAMGDPDTTAEEMEKEDDADATSHGGDRAPETEESSFKCAYCPFLANQTNKLARHGRRNMVWCGKCVKLTKSHFRKEAFGKGRAPVPTMYILLPLC